MGVLKYGGDVEVHAGMTASQVAELTAKIVAKLDEQHADNKEIKARRKKIAARLRAEQSRLTKPRRPYRISISSPPDQEFDQRTARQALHIAVALSAQRQLEKDHGPNRRLLVASDVLFGYLYDDMSREVLPSAISFYLINKLDRSIRLEMHPAHASELLEFIHSRRLIGGSQFITRFRNLIVRLHPWSGALQNREAVEQTYHRIMREYHRYRINDARTARLRANAVAIADVSRANAERAPNESISMLVSSSAVLTSPSFIDGGSQDELQLPVQYVYGPAWKCFAEDRADLNERLTEMDRLWSIGDGRMSTATFARVYHRNLESGYEIHNPWDEPRNPIDRVHHIGNLRALRHAVANTMELVEPFHETVADTINVLLEEERIIRLRQLERWLGEINRSHEIFEEEIGNTIEFLSLVKEFEQKFAGASAVRPLRLRLR